MKAFFTFIYRLFSGRCTKCGGNSFTEYGYYGNYRCNGCGEKS